MQSINQIQIESFWQEFFRVQEKISTVADDGKRQKLYSIMQQISADVSKGTTEQIIKNIEAQSDNLSKASQKIDQIVKEYSLMIQKQSEKAEQQREMLEYYEKQKKQKDELEQYQKEQFIQLLIQDSSVDMFVSQDLDLQQALFSQCGSSKNSCSRPFQPPQPFQPTFHCQPGKQQIFTGYNDERIKKMQKLYKQIGVERFEILVQYKEGQLKMGDLYNFDLYNLYSENQDIIPTFQEYKNLQQCFL